MTRQWSALRCGATLGVHCALCCFSFTLVALIAGLMNWRAMALVTVAITTERLLPIPQHYTRYAAVGIYCLTVACMHLTT